MMDVWNTQDYLKFEQTNREYEWVNTTGCVAFIGLLLFMAGVELNPGPGTTHEIFCQVKSGTCVLILLLLHACPS